MFPVNLKTIDKSDLYNSWKNKWTESVDYKPKLLLYFVIVYFFKDI